MARRLTTEERTIANALVYALQTVGEPLARAWAKDRTGDFTAYQADFKARLLVLVPSAERIQLTEQPFTARCAVCGKAARVTFRFEKAIK
jgi:hypothetical protein